MCTVPLYQGCLWNSCGSVGHSGGLHLPDLKVKKNREDLKELCHDALEIIKIVRDQISANGGTSTEIFKGLCEDLEKCLQAILDEIRPLLQEYKGFRSRFKEVLKLSRTTAQISGHQTRIQTLHLNFMLIATMDTNFQVHKLAVMAPSMIPTDMEGYYNYANIL
ncbi:hypothetical protein FB451DRAFT_1294175 [Mycena latifolia]|nr:hypothetical protein FB451DRAFT_1294175 [Mycena latifolia]